MQLRPASGQASLRLGWLFFHINSNRVANREALHAIIVETFGALVSPEVTRRLEEAQIANARINDMHALWHHEQLEARQRWVDVETPAGRIPAMLPPGISRRAETRMDAIPSLGQHTEAILKELGYGSQETEVKAAVVMPVPPWG